MMSRSYDELYDNYGIDELLYRFKVLFAALAIAAAVALVFWAA